MALPAMMNRKRYLRITPFRSDESKLRGACGGVLNRLVQVATPRRDNSVNPAGRLVWDVRTPILEPQMFRRAGYVRTPDDSTRYLRLLPRAINIELSGLTGGLAACNGKWVALEVNPLCAGEIEFAEYDGLWYVEDGHNSGWPGGTLLEIAIQPGDSSKIYAALGGYHWWSYINYHNAHLVSGTVTWSPDGHTGDPTLKTLAVSGDKG